MHVEMDKRLEEPPEESARRCELARALAEYVIKKEVLSQSKTSLSAQPIFQLGGGR